MSFLFASSHLPAFRSTRPEPEEEEDENREALPRSGAVRASSHLEQAVRGEPAAPRPVGPSAPAHLPSWGTEPPETEDKPQPEADTGSHVDFAPHAPAGGGNQGSIGPSSPRGSAPTAGRNLFLTPRPMPPEYARQMATTYGAAPGSRGSGGTPGSGDKPAATAPSTRPVTIQDLLDAHKKYETEAEPTVAPGNETVSRPAGPTKIAGFTVLDPDLYKKNQAFETLLQKQQAMGKAANNERVPLEANANNIESLGGLRTALKITKAAQDMIKKRIPKEYRDTFDRINKETGLAPAEQIKNVDAKITASKARTSELKENARQADEAHQKALNETQEAWKAKKELEKKLEQQRKQPLEEEQNQTPAPLPWMPPIVNADPA